MIETIGSKRYIPCKDCPDRYPACSDHCRKPEYLAYREEQEKIRRARKAYYTPAWAHEETNPANYRKHVKRW